MSEPDPLSEQLLLATGLHVGADGQFTERQEAIAVEEPFAIQLGGETLA